MGQRIAADTSGVHTVIFLQMIIDPDMLCNIPVCHMHIIVSFLESCVKRPAHNTHESSVPEGFASLKVKLDLALMVFIMASIA